MKKGIWLSCIITAVASWGVAAQEGVIESGINNSPRCQATDLDYSLFGTTEISASNNHNIQITRGLRRVFAVCTANFDEGLLLTSGFQDLGACTVDGSSLSSLRSFVEIDANENGGGNFFVFCSGYPDNASIPAN